ncbi:hypothetical protein C8R47DRAFT_1144522 [Mycena vitilis]|nr:hypothetical protein C8R47DRAFT_1144522 [Mycena vitilis]
MPLSFLSGTFPLLSASPIPSKSCLGVLTIPGYHLVRHRPSCPCHYAAHHACDFSQSLLSDSDPSPHQYRPGRSKSLCNASFPTSIQPSFIAQALGLPSSTAICLWCARNFISQPISLCITFFRI